MTGDGMEPTGDVFFGGGRLKSSDENVYSYRSGAAIAAAPAFSLCELDIF